MRGFKSFFGIIGALMPVVYCGGLLYYFVDRTGSIREADAIGLGPTMVGLAVVGLLFSIPLILKVVRMLIALRSSAASAHGGNDAPKQDNFDADAVLARYMANRPAEGASNAPPQHQGGNPAPRPTFGRKIK